MILLEILIQTWPAGPRDDRRFAVARAVSLPLRPDMSETMRVSSRVMVQPSETSPAPTGRVPPSPSDVPDEREEGGDRPIADSSLSLPVMDRLKLATKVPRTACAARSRLEQMVATAVLSNPRSTSRNRGLREDGERVRGYAIIG
jgi:hypothetical protein